MREITVKVYRFHELNDTAKEVAREWFKGWGDYPDQGWWEGVYEMWKEKLEKLGFTGPEIRFSGFWSQGDGARFTCKSVDLLKWLKERPEKEKEYSSIIGHVKDDSIEMMVSATTSSYVHQHTAKAEITKCFDSELSEEQSNLVNALECDVEDDRLSLSNQIYKDLEKEYEYQVSDECVDELITANGYEFEESGKNI